MAQQKSEDRVVPDGGVMPAQPADGGQGKAVPVEQTVAQLQLPIATAEDPQGSVRKAVRDRSRAGRTGVPKAIVTEGNSPLAMMEEVADRVDSAMKKVVANKGAPGPDGMTVGQLREQWPTIASRLRAELLSGMYRPGEIRRAMIPKVDGGQRALGIPNVVDRVVMEAVRQVLERCSSLRLTPQATGSGPVEAATRRLPRPSSMCAMGMSGWSTSIWRSSLIASIISG